MSDRARRWAPGLPSRRYRYMTARCPQGCDWWSIPPAVDRHTRSGNCKRQPWALARAGELLIAGDNHTRLGVLALLPPELVRPAQAGDRAYFPLARDRYLPSGVLGGTVLTSPFPDIPARRWLEVADAALRRFGPAAITETLDRARFAELEQTLGTAEGFVSFPRCGDWLQQPGLIGHQRTSTRCRFLVAHRAVEAAWVQGWRDPWSLRPRVPVVWAELSRGRWRHRIRTVEYPQWTAVLIAPSGEALAP
ncbi:MAG: hypothetical protein ACRDZ0_00160 [Acidimicrobiales bacterium]